MPEILNIPSDFYADQQEPDFLLHQFKKFSKTTIKHKIVATSHWFCFVLKGEKVVHFNDQSIQCGNDKGLMFVPGNYLMSERTIYDKQYESLLFFFSHGQLSAIKDKYPDIFRTKHLPHKMDYFVFQRNHFIQQFVASLQEILSSVTNVSDYLLPLKFEELMLYLAQIHPESFPEFIASIHAERPTFVMEKIINKNINELLSLKDLAFLCHMSPSTFKRKFECLYGMSPIRWFHKKRMAQAAVMLRQQLLNASEIYEELGYENLSSFIQAFKKEYGITPKAYQIGK
jgi:AraC-like DNA-binding protein